MRSAGRFRHRRILVGAGLSQKKPALALLGIPPGNHSACPRASKPIGTAYEPVEKQEHRRLACVFRNFCPADNGENPDRDLKPTAKMAVLLIFQQAAASVPLFPALEKQATRFQIG